MSSVARRYYERGRAALDVGDLESAQEAFRAALDLAPSFGDARVAYAVALAKASDCPRAARATVTIRPATDGVLDRTRQDREACPLLLSTAL